MTIRRIRRKELDLTAIEIATVVGAGQGNLPHRRQPHYPNTTDWVQSIEGNVTPRRLRPTTLDALARKGLMVQSESTFILTDKGREWYEQYVKSRGEQ